MISILLVDDHPLFRKGLRALLEIKKRYVVVGEAETAAAAIDSIAQLKPAIVLMDLELKDSSGIDVARTIHEDHPDAKVIILTAFSDGQLIYAAIQAGVAGYLLKSFEPDDLFSAIERVHEGDIIFSPTLAPNVLNELVKRGHTHKDDPRIRFNLTDRELEIIRYLSKGYSNQEIGSSMHLSVNTVKVHVFNIMSKLKCRNRVEVTIFAYDNGITFKDETIS